MGAQFNIAATYHYPQTMLRPQNLNHSLSRQPPPQSQPQSQPQPQHMATSQMAANKVLIPQILPPALSAHVPPPLPALNGGSGPRTQRTAHSLGDGEHAAGS